MPGLIDMNVNLSAPGGIYKDARKYTDPAVIERRLAAYLYCGVTAVRTIDGSLALRSKVRTGELLGAEPFAYAHAAGPSQIDKFKQAGIDGIEATVDNRLDGATYRAVIARAAADRLPSATDTKTPEAVRDALEAGTNTIERGSVSSDIPDPLFAAMQSRGVVFDPLLSAEEALAKQSAGDTEPLERSLVRRVAPPDLLQSTGEWLAGKEHHKGSGELAPALAFPNSNLLRAYHAGVLLTAGSGAGNLLVIHGPTVQHELALWVKAGIPPGIALRAATYNAAKTLHAEERIGLIAPGHEATLLLLDGDPVEDITFTERIAGIFFKGEEVSRKTLLNEQAP